MANTTNFGWETPDDTDLVKDGAAAMRTLGGAIDTSLVDLKGGTTDQVLAKNSNTDMDFKWVDTDDTNAIQNAIVDAKGDLIAASAADTPARLAVGNNGDTLLADSAATTGLRWSAQPSASNPIINSAFQIAQRGTSFSTGANASAYTLDRWLVRTFAANMANTVSRQNTSDTTNLPFIQYCARVQRNSGQTGTSSIFFEQGVETLNSIPYAGKTVTLSFYARKGTNFSATSDILSTQIVTGTGTDQMPASYTGSVAQSANHTLTANWQRFTQTVTLAATTTEFGLGFYYTCTGTAGAADYYELTGVQVDIGNVALPFRTQGVTLQGELAACQRYYVRLGGQQIADSIGTGFGISATKSWFWIPLAVPMRKIPTTVEYNLLRASDTQNKNAVTALTLVPDENSNVLVALEATATSTQYRTVFLQGSNTGNYLGLGAEL